ncbi:MAG: hypothetical protein OEW88_00060 [Gammaproteobacteria bacterium]|nr:hypothetical protein [Gammaproteobacteria bacterium]
MRICIAALLILFSGQLGAAAGPAAGWPREVRSGDATIVVYQPQLDSLEGIEAKARVAVQIRRPDVEPEFGALWVAATLDVDRDAEIARIQSFVIERARFPDATEEEVGELTRLIEKTAPDWDMGMTLAELRAGLEADADGDEPRFRNDPPKIIYRDKPAILVTLDGAPRLQVIQGTPYQRVINTPFPIIYDSASREYWLFGSEVWFASRQLLGGQWQPKAEAPAGIAQLFAGTNDEPPPEPGAGVPPEKLRQAVIVVVTEPSELISTDGEPQYQPLVGDEMLYVTNTGSDLFLEVPTRQYYVVLSGRWYRSRSLDGPWAYVAPGQVPQAFAEVPKKSARAEVLAHVPGTDEAKDAMMDAMIPQTSAIRRSDASLEVTYDGTPRFDRIPGTSLYYARNSATQVLKYEDHYYAVDQGVWYIADSAYGPWAVAQERPPEVDQIPATSPAYNVKYVYIYDYTPDIVYVGYLPGYAWAFPYRGTIVYGTGYYYRPWISPYYYYPRPSTWGFHMHYDPWYGWGYGMSWTAGWTSFSWAWGGGWGGWPHGYQSGYANGYWSGYNRGVWYGQHTGGWFGPGGYRPPRPSPRRGIRPPDRRHVAAVPRSGERPAYRPSRGNNLYARRGNSPTVDARRRAQPPTRSGVQPDGRSRPPPSGERRTTQPVKPRSARMANNVFVDREGIPHRITRQGWQTRENHSWRPAPELNRRTAARGADRQPAPSRTDRRVGTRPDSRRTPAPASTPAPGTATRQSPPPRDARVSSYRPSPPVDLTRRRPAPETRSAERRPQPGSRQPPEGGWGNRAGPRGGPALPSSNAARTRGRELSRRDRRQ